MGARDGYGFVSVSMVLVLSSRNFIGMGVAQVIGSLIGISEARLIGGSLEYLPVGRYIGSSIIIS